MVNQKLSLAVRPMASASTQFGEMFRNQSGTRGGQNQLAMGAAPGHSYLREDHRTPACAIATGRPPEPRVNGKDPDFSGPSHDLPALSANPS